MNADRDAAAGSAALVAAVQHNCDLADAQHAREQGLCTYLLAMRELYRWAVQAPLGAALDRAQVGAWIAQREQHWERLLDGEARWRALPLGAGIDPFDEDAVNAALRARHAGRLVYGAGLGRQRAPLFFVAEVEQQSVRDGIAITVTEAELARGLAAPPAAARGGRVLVRRDALRRWLWTRIEGAQLRTSGAARSAPGEVQSGGRGQHGDAFAALLARFGGADRGAAVERIVQSQTDTLVLHELGELRAGELLGADWEAMLAAADRRTEVVLRALRDLLADALVTLPALLARGDGDALAFWEANLEGMRRALAADLLAAGDRNTTGRIDDARAALLARALDLRRAWRDGGATALAAAAASLG